MKTKNIIEGLSFLSSFRKNKEGHHVGAEHDVIYAYATDYPLSDENVQYMIDLGWFQEDKCGDDGEFMAKHYAPDESWAAYV